MGPGQGEKKNPSGQSLCCTNVWDWRQGKFVQPGLRDLIPSRQIKLEKLRLNPTFLPHRGQMIREMGSQLRALHPPGFQRGKPGTGHSGSSFPTARGWSGTWQRLQDSLPQPSPCSTRGGVFLGLRGWSGQIQGIRAARSLQGSGSEQRDPNQGSFTISSGTGRDPRPFQGPVASRAKILLCRMSSPHQGRFSTSSLNHLFVPVLDFHFSTENHRRIPNLWHKPLQDSPPCAPPALDLIPPRGAEGSRATLLSPAAGSVPSRRDELSPAPLRGPG